MSALLEIDLQVPLDRFSLEVTWSSTSASLGVFGPSGSGKTTILEALAGLRSAARGTIRFGGHTWLDSARGISLPPETRGVGYVPQDALLFPHMDLIGNVLAGRLRALRAGRRALDPDRVLEVLELAPLRNRRVKTLSGGERQRAALARALCSAPDLLLLDEPLAGLDLALRRRILPYLARVREEFGLPTIHVSHDPAEIGLLCDEVLALDTGRALAVGRPADLFMDPRVLPVALSEGFENLLAGRVLSLDDGAAVVEVDPALTLTIPGDGLLEGRRVTVGVRAEDLILSVGEPERLSAQNRIAGTIVEVRVPAGGAGPVMVIVRVGRNRTPIVAAVTRRASEQLELAPGRSVHLIVKAHSFHVLASI